MAIPCSKVSREFSLFILCQMNGISSFTDGEGGGVYCHIYSFHLQISCTHAYVCVYLDMYIIVYLFIDVSTLCLSTSTHIHNGVHSKNC